MSSSGAESFERKCPFYRCDPGDFCCVNSELEPSECVQGKNGIDAATEPANTCPNRNAAVRRCHRGQRRRGSEDGLRLKCKELGSSTYVHWKLTYLLWRAYVATALDGYDSARAFACAIHKASYPGADPLALAFEDLCSRFDLYLSRMHAEGDRQRGLIILDESSHETTLQGMARNFTNTWNAVAGHKELRRYALICKFKGFETCAI